MMKKKILTILLFSLVFSLIFSVGAVPAFAEGAGVDLVLPVQIFSGETEAARPETYQLLLTADEADFPLPEGGADGSYVQEITGSGSAKLKFHFNRVGVYTYTLRQREGTNADEVYDRAVYVLTAYVLDRDGELSAMVTLHAQEGAGKLEMATFANAYVAPVQDSPLVRKEIIGAQPSQSTDFTFRLTAVSNTAGLEENPMPDGAEGQVKTVTIRGAGEKAFGPITFRRSGQYVYRVTEDDTGAKDYRYDGAVYTLVYEVTRQDAALAVDCTVQKDGEAVENITFTNRYLPPPQIPKTGDGRLRQPCILLVLSGAGLLILAATRRKEDK